MAHFTGHKRRQLFVDASVQGAVLRRVVIYWFLGMAVVLLGLLCYRITTGPARPFYTHLDDMWFHYGPVFIATLLMLPVVAYDCVKLTHRFAGPMFRMRRAMKTLAQGKTTHPVHFRDNDFWRDFAEDFNSLLARTEQVEAGAGDSALSEAEPQTEDQQQIELVESTSL